MAVSEKKIPFDLNEYIKNQNKKKKNNDNISNTSEFLDNEIKFKNLCKSVRDYFNQEWETEQGKDSRQSEILLERQKKAIIGYKSEVNYFKDKINEYLRVNNLLNEWYPSWYKNLTDAIFHENWGLAGIAKWLDMPDSSSAKIIGDRIYYLINGKQVLQQQRISLNRFEQLRKALLLRVPKKKVSDPYIEVPTLTGERITVYSGDLTKEGQPVMVFRKYIVEDYTFEKQAELGTIEKDSIPMMKAMAQIGYNVVFTGAVRTGKTTFLQTWQSYENPNLEGVMVETDPEIPLHKLMPNAPIMQLIADDEDTLKNITKSLMRSDCDYIIMAEARDGYALNLVVEIANKGTRRCKTTYHITDVNDFCYDVANNILKTFGGKLDYIIAKVAKSYNYAIHLVQLPNRNKKRLEGIYEIRFNQDDYSISIHQICRYDFLKDSWTFKYDIGEDKRKIAMQENYEAFKVFEAELRKLAAKYPMQGNHITIPFYGRILSETK